MDYSERYEDRVGALRESMVGHQASVWTALPGIIQSFDATTLTAQVQPAIQSTFTGPDQQQKRVTLPLLPDVPVVMPHGGKYAATFPISAGDECLIVFASRCIDGWWDQGGVQPQSDARMHDLSDGFAIPGAWSQKTKITNWSTTTAQLRTTDGTVYAEIDAPNQKARLVSNGVIIEADSKNNVVNITAPTINITGNVAVTGNLTATGAIIAGSGGGDQVNLQLHQHGTTGSVASATFPPTPGT